MAGILGSNSSEIPFSDRYFAKLEATVDVSTASLRDSLREKGYVYLPRYIDSEMVLALRAAYFAQFPRSLFKVGSRLVDGYFSGQYPSELAAYGTEGHPAFAFVRSEPFRTFVSNPRLHQLAETFLETTVIRVRRTPLRHFIRGREVATRAHIDFSYLDYGSKDGATFWIPIGECPVLAGGPIYLEGSEGLDLGSLNLPTDRPEDSRSLTHDLRYLSDITGRRWLWADFVAGDLVVHSPFIIHASVNVHIDLMRLSTDVRFRSTDAKIDPRWENDWRADDGY
jgi:hypothetical protein